MLPFTKRPGKGDEASDVVSKDDVSKPGEQSSASLSGVSGPPSKRSVPPPSMRPPPPPSAPSSIRPPAKSAPEEEVTTFLPTKSLGDAVPSVRVGPPSSASVSRPASVPPPSLRSRPATTPPPRSSVKSGKILVEDDEDDEGRTVIRGAPKIVKRANKGAGMGQPTGPTTLSPAAVIKATLESARSGKRSEAGLVAGPPVDLLEDDADVHPADAGPQRTAILAQDRQGPNSVPPSSMNPGVNGGGFNSSLAMAATQHSMHGPMSQPPMSVGPHSQPPMSGVMHGPMSMSQPPMSMGPVSQPPPSSGYPQGYQSMPPHSAVSVPGVAMSASMPAHFMVPQAPYSDGRMDPPGASITNRHKVSGRPTTSWAVALLAFGLFVGVGAVAAMQQNNGVMDTTASFVDPARAQQQPQAQAQGGAVQNAPVNAPVNGAQPPAPVVTAPVVATPNAAAPGAPVAAAAAPAPAGEAAAAPTGAVLGASAPPAAPAPAPADPKEAKEGKEKTAKADKPPKHHWSPPPAPAPKATAEKKAEKVAAADDEKPAKPTKKTSKADDEETRKALEDLKKAQLESASSFGEK